MGIEILLQEWETLGKSHTEIWQLFKQKLIDHSATDVMTAKAKADLETLRFNDEMGPQGFMTKVQTALYTVNLK